MKLYHVTLMPEGREEFTTLVRANDPYHARTLAALEAKDKNLYPGDLTGYVEFEVEERCCADCLGKVVLP